MRGLFALAVLAGVGCSVPLLAQQYDVGTRVEVDGLWQDDVLNVEKIVIEEPDDYPEIKGHLSDLKIESRVIIIGPFTIEVPPGTDIRDNDRKDKEYHLGELRAEWRLKIEVEPIVPLRFRALKIDVDRNPSGALLELEAFVEESRTESDGTTILVLLGVPCRIGGGTERVQQIFWKRERIGVQEDEERPEDQLVLFEVLTIGGEVQTDSEYRDDFDLDSSDNKDTFEQDTSMVLEATLDLGRMGYAFAKVRTAKAYVMFDEDRDLDRAEATKIEEVNVYLENLANTGLSLLVGRQDFDERREWIYDENLDAVRLLGHWNSFSLEYSWSTFLHDAPRGFSDRVNQILLLSYSLTAKTWFSAYMVDIRDDSDADDSPFYLGLRALSRERRLRYWFDYSYLDGVLGEQKREAHAVDAGIGYLFRDLPLKPYVFVSYAFGSGDDRSGGRTSREYRQTGYQDNNDRIFGVASYRYYGELLEPELSNLHIATVGIGIMPTSSFSIDLVFHDYRQEVASTVLADSNLRASPSGRKKQIGKELDLIVGFDKIWGRMDIELDIGYFMPGSAFAENDHEALWVRLQVEWNF